MNQVEILRDTIGGLILQIVSLQAKVTELQAFIPAPEVTNVSS